MIITEDETLGPGFYILNKGTKHIKKKGDQSVWDKLEHKRDKIHNTTGRMAHYYGIHQRINGTRYITQQEERSITMEYTRA
jgi:hypothetical protein